MSGNNNKIYFFVIISIFLHKHNARDNNVF